MDDCLFCKVINGDIPCYKVYEDEKVLAVLDTNPLSRGHVLVMPKEHFENVFDIPAYLYEYVFSIAKKISMHIKEKYNPEGILINQNNGSRAGQSILHLHVHVKPMYKDTVLFNEESHRLKLEEEEMKKILSDLILEVV